MATFDAEREIGYMHDEPDVTGRNQINVVSCPTATGRLLTALERKPSDSTAVLDSVFRSLSMEANSVPFFCPRLRNVGSIFGA
jgi:hypothetical protein